MFGNGERYKNRRFDFTVIAVSGDRMLVVTQDGEKAVLSVELQSRIQRNIERENVRIPASPGFRERDGERAEKRMSGWQLNSLVKFLEYKNGGIIAECRDCQQHSPIFDVDELREFYLIHPKHKTNANDGYYDADEIENVLAELHRQPVPKRDL